MKGLHMYDKRRVLVVVDMQNDFCLPGGALSNADCVAAVPAVERLVESGDWDRIVFTKDSHRGDYMSTLEGVKLPVPHCARHTMGWSVVQPLTRFLGGDNVKVVEKSTFGSLDLRDAVGPLYREDELHVCGVCTSICVLVNCALLRTWFPDNRIYVHEEAVADVSPSMNEEALDCLESFQCDVLRVPRGAVQ